jgi:magnesium-transporting ATPase (P-type)
MVFCYKDLNEGQNGANHDEPVEQNFVKDVENDEFTFVALFGFEEILHEDALSAIEKIQKAGATVRMVTQEGE